jgi:hypothetical protein
MMMRSVSVRVGQSKNRLTCKACRVHDFLDLDPDPVHQNLRIQIQLINPLWIWARITRLKPLIGNSNLNSITTPKIRYAFS